MGNGVSRQPRWVGLERLNAAERCEELGNSHPLLKSWPAWCTTLHELKHLITKNPLFTVGFHLNGGGVGNFQLNQDIIDTPEKLNHIKTITFRPSSTAISISPWFSPPAGHIGHRGANHSLPKISFNCAATCCQIENRTLFYRLEL